MTVKGVDDLPLISAVGDNTLFFAQDDTAPSGSRTRRAIGSQLATYIGTNVSVTIPQVSGLVAALAGKQPLNAELTNLSAQSSTGILARTAAATYTERTFTGTANQITVTNGDGVAGNPTFSLPSALTFTGFTVTGGTFASPTLTTPTLGVATATTVNKVAFTAPLTGSTLTVADGKTLTASNTITFTATDGSTLAIGGGGTLGSNAYTSTAYAPIASPVFTGVVTVPTPFTLGAVSVTATGTQINYLSGATGTTGTGLLVYGTSPTLVTPALGTPAAVVLTNATGTAAGLTAGNVTTNANLTGVITSVGNATSIASQTGTGTKFVMDTAPTITGGAHTALTGLGVRSTGAAFDLTLASSEILTAGRTLSVVMGDAARTLTFAGNATISGSNTGDQTITLTGDVTGAGTGSFATAIGATKVTGAMLNTSIITGQTINNAPVAGNDYIMFYSASGVALNRCTISSLVSAGTAGVTSFNGRSGAVAPTTGDYTVAQITGAAPLASPTFTGVVTFPTPFTLGAVSVTSTGTQLNYLSAATGTTGTGNSVLGTSPTIATPTVTTPTITGGTHTALTALGIRSTGAAFDLTLASSEVLTAGRSLSFNLGDAARTLTIGASASVAGTNTGDQTITLTGDVTGTGTGSFATAIGATKVTGTMLNVSTITGQTLNNSPVSANDYVMFYSATGVALNKCTISSLISAGTAGVTTFNGRSGAVVPVSGDYTVSLVTGAAPLASPTFTGTPAAPTPTVSTNTTQLATTAFVVGQAATVAPLINSVAAVGTSLLYARQDHIHATDTTLLPLTGGTLTGTLAAPNLIDGFTTTATAAGTTTLTNTSTGIQVFTGSTTQNLNLPTTSVIAGQQYLVINSSTGVVTVRSSGANNITAMAANTSALFTALVATPTTAANWSSSYTALPLPIAGGTMLGALNVSTVALTDGATPALDASLGNLFTLSAAGDRTIGIPTNPAAGQRFIIRHFASGAARTLALNTGAGGFSFGTDITGLTQTASGAYDYIGCAWNVTKSKFDVIAYAKSY